MTALTRIRTGLGLNLVSCPRVCILSLATAASTLVRISPETKMTGAEPRVAWGYPGMIGASQPEPQVITCCFHAACTFQGQFWFLTGFG